MSAANAPRVEVDAGGRGGDVLYHGASGTLRFCWEVTAFGYEIAVPNADLWEQQTGLPLGVRAQTLALLGEAFRAKRCGGRGTWTVADGPYSAVEIRP